MPVDNPTPEQQELPIGDPAPAPKPTAPVAPAELTKKQIAALRKEWEAELHTKTGGKPIDEIIESHKKSEEEKLAAAEAAKTELERITGRADKAEKAHASEIARARALEEENRSYRLTDRVREVADAAQLRQPQYKKLVMSLLKERAQLSKDGSVVWLDDKGQPDAELDGATVLAKVLESYPDLTGSAGGGFGGGTGSGGGNSGGGNGAGDRERTKQMTRDEENRIFAGLLKTPQQRS